MELCYRGANYEWNSYFTVTTKSGIQGKDHRIPPEFRKLASLTPQARLQQTHRGVAHLGK